MVTPGMVLVKVSGGIDTVVVGIAGTVKQMEDGTEKAGIVTTLERVRVTRAPASRVRDLAGMLSGLAATVAARMETMARNCILKVERRCWSWRS